MKLNLKTYAALKKEIRKKLAEGERAIERVKIRTNWELGKLIAEHIKAKNPKGRAAYGHNVVHRLANDLETNKPHLYRCLEFYGIYPIVATSQQLTWSHYRELLSINDPVQFKRLAKQAEAGGWSVRLLRTKIGKLKGTLRQAQGKKLVPRKGKPGVYAVTTYNGKPAYDLGFSTFKVIRRTPRKKKVKPSDLYTYHAKVERVIDGDTFWAWVDLGFGLGTRQKLRLRGIDTPELHTGAGKRAKEFVESVIAGRGDGEAILSLEKIAAGKKRPRNDESRVLVKTSQSDKYDRYLADVFTDCGSQTGNKSQKTGGKGLPARDYLFVNQLLLDQGHAVVARG